MRIIAGVVLSVVLLSSWQVSGQALTTRVLRVEIDGKKVETNYKVFFLSDGRWMPFERTVTGFMVPEVIKAQDLTSVMFVFGKHKLEFSGIHNSKFSEDWIVGIDNKPFSKEFVSAEEAQRISRVYYIKFEGNGIGTVQVVTEKKE